MKFLKKIRKVFDIRKAKEQLNLYRELYDPDNDVMKGKDPSTNKTNTNTPDNINNKINSNQNLNIKNNTTENTNKLLSVASEEDKEKIKKALRKYENLDADEIKQ